MFTTQPYRPKAAECIDLARVARNPAEALEFQTLERNFTALADNGQWLADNQGKVLHWETKVGFAGDDTSGPEEEEEDEEEEEEEDEKEAGEEQVLRCLGAALIMQWNNAAGAFS
jgi:Ran GTPase-activating protein (RanGAP) involved in mRNA processing and transport